MKTPALSDSLLQHWPGAFFQQRPDFTFESVSPKMETLTGISASRLGKTPGLFWHTVHELDLARVKKEVERVSATPDGITSLFRIRQAPSARVLYISEFRRAVLDAKGKILGYEGFWLDATRQTKVEQRLAASAWKEVLSQVTLGFVHDFNNSLTGILAVSQFYLSQTDARHPFHEGLTLLSQNAEKAAQMVQRLAQLHQTKTGQRGYHDLNTITSDTVELLRKLFLRRIEVTVSLTPGALAVYTDAVELRQVIFSLAQNAVEAMPEGGRILFQTSLHDTFPALSHVQGVLPKLPCVCLTITDNGVGIRPGLLGAIFDLQATTKPGNKGTGLGLHLARSLLEKLNGAVSVESEKGAGATFRIWLAQADFTEAEKMQQQNNARLRTLLVVGRDEKSIAGQMEFLQRYRFRVMTATPSQAEELLFSSDLGFDGLFLKGTSKHKDLAALLSLVRKFKLPLKTIMQVTDATSDESTASAPKADLMIAGEPANSVIAEQLTALFR